MNGRSKRTVAIYLGLVFVAGSILGAAAHRFYAVQSADAGVATTRRTSEEYRKELMVCLRTELKLTPEQVIEVDRIYDDIGGRYKEVRKVIDPEVKALRVERTERIMSLLDDQQKVQYQQILDERERKRQEERTKSSSGASSSANGVSGS
ncbi:MAG: hypothetical protein O2968_14440 [Acidobacteria bacterium]|nr:hypothetical protein [Acidobacteriota bacterium]